MSASYKPTLLAAIVKGVEAGIDPTRSISLASLADEYARLYWSQVVVFRLRHSPRDSAPPVIVQLILEASERNRVRKLGELADSERRKLIRKIANVLPTNVLSAFHASKPESMPPLYAWDEGESVIRLTVDAVAFVHENARSLTLIANYFLARFLSKLNTVPHIVEKVERDAAKRGSLAPFAAQLRALGESACFYCDASLDVGVSTIDHFIPWTFVFEDRLWNLVPACRVCNSSKSDRLPDEVQLQRLLLLNKLRESRLPAKAASHFRTVRGVPELQHLFKLARDEGWPNWRAAPESSA